MNQPRPSRIARIAILNALFALATILHGCGDGGTPAAGAQSPSAGIASVVSRGSAEGTAVTEAKRTSASGQEVAIVGRIGGSENPFAKDRAVFTIVDLALKSCADGSDPDHCKTPWDYCCEDRIALRNGTATIEIAGADGRPVRASAQGVAGLDPLAVVTVVGTVTERNDQGLLVVRAKRIEVR